VGGASMVLDTNSALNEFLNVSLKLDASTASSPRRSSGFAGKVVAGLKRGGAGRCWTAIRILFATDLCDDVS
jgi:hypothetical protein